MHVIKISNSMLKHGYWKKRENILWIINRFSKPNSIKVITLNGAVRKKWQKRVNYWEITIQHQTRKSYFRWIYFTNTVCNKVFSSLIVIVMLCNDCTNGGKVGEEGGNCVFCARIWLEYICMCLFLLTATSAHQMGKRNLISSNGFQAWKIYNTKICK